MNQSIRPELLETLAELRRRYPDWRLGQLIVNVSGWADRDVWDVEDDELLAAAEQHLHDSANPKQQAST